MTYGTHARYRVENCVQKNRHWLHTIHVYSCYSYCSMQLTNISRWGLVGLFDGGTRVKYCSVWGFLLSFDLCLFLLLHVLYGE